MSPAPAGIDQERLEDWLSANVAGCRPPLTFTLLVGGRSNLTFKVEDSAGHAYVLRRPPLGQVLATAHDMGREHRIISALGDTAVPVPAALGYCEDPEVNGAPFYVMDFVDGSVLWSVAGAEAALTVEARRAAAESLVHVLADLHAVDPDAVGLGDLSRREGYIERQLKRWYRQFQSAKTREIPLVDKVHDILLRGIPEQGPATIVHGDYKLENCILDETGQVVGVLDWELCTLGDPLADLGILSVYWPDPGEAGTSHSSPALAEGFPRRADLLQRYAEVSGRDLSQMDYYAAFGHWKLACVADGVYTRYAGGSMGQDGADLDFLQRRPVVMAERAAEAAARIGRS